MWRNNIYTVLCCSRKDRDVREKSTLESLIVAGIKNTSCVSTPAPCLVSLWCLWYKVSLGTFLIVQQPHNNSKKLSCNMFHLQVTEI